jgi:DNA-binding transcriptional ArsR family regulator
MSEKYIMVSLDDDEASYLADAISNKTCKKILKYLVDKEACETEIAQDLKLPANTVNYNIKKLLKARLIEKSKDYFWSIKGKKMLKYKVAKKNIVISPKSSSSIKILSAFLATGIGAFLLKLFLGSGKQVDNLQDSAKSGFGEAIVADSGAEVFSKSMAMTSNFPEIWIWFFMGGIFALVIFMILNWRKL